VCYYCKGETVQTKRLQKCAQVFCTWLLSLSILKSLTKPQETMSVPKSGSMIVDNAPSTSLTELCDDSASSVAGATANPTWEGWKPRRGAKAGSLMFLQDTNLQKMIEALKPVDVEASQQTLHSGLYAAEWWSLFARRKSRECLPNERHWLRLLLCRHERTDRLVLPASCKQIAWEHRATSKLLKKQTAVTSAPNVFGSMG